jgi:hypothetical protein
LKKSKTNKEKVSVIEKQLLPLTSEKDALDFENLKLKKYFN